MASNRAMLIPGLVPLVAVTAGRGNSLADSPRSPNFNTATVIAILDPGFGNSPVGRLAWPRLRTSSAKRSKSRGNDANAARAARVAFTIHGDIGVSLGTHRLPQVTAEQAAPGDSPLARSSTQPSKSELGDLYTQNAYPCSPLHLLTDSEQRKSCRLLVDRIDATGVPGGRRTIVHEGACGCQVILAEVDASPTYRAPVAGWRLHNRSRPIPEYTRTTGRVGVEQTLPNQHTGQRRRHRLTHRKNDVRIALRYCSSAYHSCTSLPRCATSNASLHEYSSSQSLQRPFGILRGRLQRQRWPHHCPAIHFPAAAVSAATI